MFLERATRQWWLIVVGVYLTVGHQVRHEYQIVAVLRRERTEVIRMASAERQINPS
jgi:hypothetical protein